VVLSDRNDLDDQLFGQFQRRHDILGPMSCRRRAAPFGGTAQAGKRRRGVHRHSQIHDGAEWQRDIGNKAVRYKLAVDAYRKSWAAPPRRWWLSPTW